MAEENLVVEEEVYVNEQCCPECLSPGECGNILEELSEAKGEDLYEAVKAKLSLLADPQPRK